MPILTFNKEQEAAVIGKRRAHNARQERLAKESEGELIGNAYTIPRDAWATYDNDLQTLQRAQLGVFSDLASLQRSVPIGKSVHLFSKVTDSGEVNSSMDGRSRAKADAPVIDYEGTPVPIYDTTFTFGWRDVEAARQDGGWQYLDAATRDNANRKIVEKMEDLIVNGDAKWNVAGNQVYGLRTAPGRATGNFGNVDLATATGAQWVEAIRRVLVGLQAKNFYGGVTIYLNYGDWFAASVSDYVTAAPQNTILARLMAIPGLVAIVPSTAVPVNEILAVVKERRVLEILTAMPVTTMPIERKNFTDEYSYQVMTAVAPQFRRDANGNAGYAQFVKGA
jgi:uncharacterized linocin/CFP29 family protein